jgi:hypothetical protein
MVVLGLVVVVVTVAVVVVGAEVVVLVTVVVFVTVLVTVTEAVLVTVTVVVGGGAAAAEAVLLATRAAPTTKAKARKNRSWFRCRQRCLPGPVWPPLRLRSMLRNGPNDPLRERTPRIIMGQGRQPRGFAAFAVPRPLSPGTTTSPSADRRSLAHPPPERHR